MLFNKLKLFKSLCIYMNIESDYYKKNNIDEFQNLMKDVETIEFYSSKYNISYEDSKYVLLMFLINGYSDELIIDKFELIYIISNNFYNKYLLSEFNGVYLVEFKKEYNIWKDIDKKNILFGLINKYNKEELDENKNKLIKQMKFIDKDYKNYLNNTDLLLNYVYTGFKYTGDPIEIIAKKAYWDSMIDSSYERKLTYIHDFLTTIIPKLKILKYDNIEIVIDIDYIDNMINNKVFNSDELLNIVNYIFDELENKDSANGNYHNKKWRSKILYIIEYLNISIIDIIPYILRDIINKIENLINLIDLSNLND